MLHWYVGSLKSSTFVPVFSQIVGWQIGHNQTMLVQNRRQKWHGASCPTSNEILVMSVCTSCHLVCLLSDEKGSRWDYPCSHHIFLTSVSETIQDRRNSLQFCGFLSCVNCISSRTVYTERTYQQPQSGSRRTKQPSPVPVRLTPLYSKMLRYQSLNQGDVQTEDGRAMMKFDDFTHSRRLIRSHKRPDRVASLLKDAPLPKFKPGRCADGGWTCDDEVCHFSHIPELEPRSAWMSLQVEQKGRHMTTVDKCALTSQLECACHQRPVGKW